MRSAASLIQFAAVAAVRGLLLLAVAGCSTTDVNPGKPRGDKCYADFYADPAREVYWQIESWDDQRKEFRVIYSEFKFPSHGVLRLELPARKNRLRVSFSNLATDGPVEVEVGAARQKAKGVMVSWAPAGGSVRRKIR